MSKNVDIKNEKYQKAIRLKYGGFSYLEIAEILKVSHISVKRWFRSDGLLKEEYERYENERNGAYDRETDRVLTRHAHTASHILVSLMGAKSDAMKFRAAKAILDYVRGPAKARDDDDFYDPDEDKRSKDQISAILESAKKRRLDKPVGNQA